jgi:outer membrane protein
MKGTSLIVSIVLFVLIAVLYVLHFTGNGSKTANSNISSGISDGKVQIIGSFA